MSADVVISPAGVQGPRGNTIWPTTGAPPSSLGVDGDWAIDNEAFVLYGPRAAGVWPSGRPFGTSGGALLAANNLDDVASASAARTNLGLGGAATLSVGTGSGTVAAGNDSRLVGALQASNDLSDLASASAARTNLGLGGAATLGVGTTSGTVAGGADTRITGALQAANDLSDLGSVAVALQNLGIAQPWLFNVQAYGAKGDGRIVVDGAMGLGSATLTSSTAVFTSNDRGKLVMAPGAGATGVSTLLGTITTVNSATSVTLSVANASGSALTGLTVLIVTDDTAAIQSAINAAVAYGESHGGSATVFFPEGIYGVGGPLVTTSSGNGQLTIPVVSATGNKLILILLGVGDGAAVQYWEQIPAQMSGSTLVSFGVFANPSAQATSINNNGNPSLLGGPSQPGGFGVSPGTFSNVHVVLQGLSLRTTYSLYGLGYTAADLSGCANGRLRDFGYGAMGTVAAADYGNPSLFGTGLSVGILMPASGNNDLVLMENVTCAGGYTYAAFVTEHCELVGVRLLYSWAGMCAVGLYYGSVGSTHAIRGMVSVEACHYHLYLIGAGSGGVGPFLHLILDTEGTVLFGDNGNGTPSASARGELVVTGEVTFPINLDHPLGCDIVNDQVTFPTTVVTSSYTVQPWDLVIEANAASGPITVTAPSAATRTKQLVVVKTDTSGNAVTVEVAGGQLISGAGSKTLSSPWATGTYAPSASLTSWNQIA